MFVTLTPIDYNW